MGTQLGSFHLTRLLGRGGMGAVYLGEHQHIGSRVAVKVLHRHLAVHPDLVARFYAEARAVNLIGHENIVNIFDMAVAPPDVYYYLMEYLEGQSLAQFAHAGPLATRVTIPILAQVCDGLGAAHDAGVIHRDLKPENIFLTRRGGNELFVKVLDFGIAKLFASATDVQTRPGAIVGTPEYMAPEQATGEAVDGRIDLYALGIIAYRLATGRLPFTAQSMTSVLLMHRDMVPPAPVKLNPAVGKPFSDVVMYALGKRPEERYQSAREFREALEQALAATERAARAAPAEAPAADPAARPGGAPDPAETQLPLPRAPSPAAPPAAAPRSPPPAPPAGASAPAAAPAPAPPAPAPPAPAAPPRARVNARVTAGATNLPGSLECRDVSRAGLFVCTRAAPPPLFTRLSLVLELEHEELAVRGEVVRHISAAQGQDWGMSSGFAVQFVEPSPEVREALEGVRTGQPVVRSEAAAGATVTLAAAAAAAAAAPDDALAERVLQAFQKRPGADPYAFLGMPQDAGFAELRQRGRELRRELEQAQTRPLSAAQSARLSGLLRQLESLLDMVSTPQKRVQTDVGRGNFRGIARCLSAGLTITELDAVRAATLQRTPGAEARAQIHLATGQSWEGRGDLRSAIEEFERGLALDPANIRLQQRYWSVRKRLDAGTGGGGAGGAGGSASGASGGSGGSGGSPR
jgi:serine/threonine-protein kinase